MFDVVDVLLEKKSEKLLFNTVEPIKSGHQGLIKIWTRIKEVGSVDAGPGIICGLSLLLVLVLAP